jgi:hypothetical protein
VPSYAYLCKKAGLPPPTGLAEIIRKERVSRERHRTELQRKEWLRLELDAMVARGELYKSADGKYGLPEWLNAPTTSSTSAACAPENTAPLTTGPATAT